MNARRRIVRAADRHRPADLAGVRKSALPPAARAALDAPYGRQVASAITFLEIEFKRATGKLDFSSERIRARLAERAFEFLPVALPHGAALRDLPRLHGDPLDRMLIARAEAEGMTLLTADEKLPPYGKRERVV